MLLSSAACKSTRPIRDPEPRATGPFPGEVAGAIARTVEQIALRYYSAKAVVELELPDWQQELQGADPIRAR